ncbi:MAG: ABC transporter permease [Candidatus Riflebacteria bacterium]|nr:ABC transporter permease [Candidatus Riflebacteria bacterium]
MSLANLSFFVNEAGTNMKRSAMMAFITISTISIALVMMGAFLLATMNLESFLQQMQSEALVTAYLKSGFAITDAKTLSLRLTSWEEVEDIEVVTPDQAARELFSSPDDQQLLKIGFGEGNNPLPTTLRIKIKSGSILESLLQKLKIEPMIDNISYGEDLFQQFHGMSQLLWLISLVIVILLGLASLFIVYNTVRLTLFMRREEIVIMKLVGATNWFVRGPFLVEGFIQGLVGSFLAIVVLFSAYRFMLAKLAELIPFFTANIGFEQLFKLSAKLLMMGIVLGISGSLLSLRDISKFSKSSPEGV